VLETAPDAMPPAFEKWAAKYDDVFGNQSQRFHFRTYLGGLLGQSTRKNIAVIAASSVGASYFNLHHFLHDAPWNAQALNDRRIDLIWHTRQTRPAVDFNLIIDDSGHRKSGSSTEGVGRQYLGQIRKVDNGIRTVTIQFNAPTFEEASDICYFLSNESEDIATAEWMARSYSRRNWIEVFYREVKGWLGMTDYQVRDLKSIERHWHLAFIAFTFLACQRWTGGLQGKYSKWPVSSFGDAFRVFNHVLECLMLRWIPKNLKLFAAHRANQGLIFS
jgi:hypothetical protein